MAGFEPFSRTPPRHREEEPPPPPPPAVRPSRGLPIAMGVTVVLLALLFAVMTGPNRLLGRLPGLGGGECRPVPVTVVVAPELQPVALDLLAELDGAPLDDAGLPGDGCLQPVVRAQRPALTIASAFILPKQRWPQVWVPSSGIWTQRAGELQVEQAGAFANSPLVLAVPTARARQLGWDRRPPSWRQALTAGERMVVAGDLESSAEGLLALHSLRQTTGTAARGYVGAAAADISGSGVSTMTDTIAMSDDGSGAAIIPTAEQTVFDINRGSPTPTLQAVYPSEGSPLLDYPVLRVDASGWSAELRAGADRVIARLLSPEGAQAAREAGFRDGAGASPGGQGVAEGAVTTVPAPDSKQVDEVLTLVAEHTEHTRMLAVIDVSTSMEGLVADGEDRISVVSDAARAALAQLPGPDEVGAWVFASDLAGSRDWAELAPIDRLDATVGSATHRDRLAGRLVGLPDRLRSGGTSLYGTVLAAVEHMRATHDPGAKNVIVVLTDGTNEDSAGIQLPELEAKLKAMPEGKPVRLVAVGIGPDADMRALGRIVAAAGDGQAFQASDPDKLREVLFETLSARG